MTPGLRKALTATFLIANLTLAASADAQLYDRGGGLIYDDVLNVTWLQDAAYQITTNAPNTDSNGKMTWPDAMNWVDTLVYTDSARNVDWDDWRLPSMSPINGITFDLTNACDGSTDNGYSITSPASELSYMYYVNLGGVPLNDINCKFQPGAGIADQSPFTGISGGVWSQTPVPTVTDNFFILGMGNGHQNWFEKSTTRYVWAVRDGDVAITPDGDLNNDGQVNVADILLGLRILTGAVTPTTEQFLHSDVAPLVNGLPEPDGTFNSGDLQVIMQKSLGLASFP